MRIALETSNMGLGKREMSSSYDMIQIFREAALAIDNRTFPTLTYNTVIADLGLDSVAMIEIIGYIEDETGIRIQDDDLGRVRTLGDLFRLVEREAA